MLTLTILNYNGNDSLRDSIQSVLDQTHKPDRFVVIDNASTDGSRQIAVDMGVEVVDADNRFKFITGLNKALEITSDYGKLFFMQNDVVLDKGCLKTMLEHAPYSSFFAQPVIYDSNGKIDNAGMDYRWPGYGERRKTKWWEGSWNEECGLVTTICFMTSSPPPRWDIRFEPAYYEDLDMYLITKKYYKHILIPHAKAYHLGNHTFSQTYKKLEISRICRINRKKLIRKHYRGLDRMIRTAVLTLLDIGKEAFDVISEWRIFSNKRH